MANDYEKILNVSMGYFSIARYSGGCTFNGKRYIYNSVDDSLTREDIWKKEQKALKQLKKEATK